MNKLTIIEDKATGKRKIFDDSVRGSGRTYDSSVRVSVEQMKWIMEKIKPTIDFSDFPKP